MFAETQSRGRISPNFPLSPGIRPGPPTHRLRGTLEGAEGPVQSAPAPSGFPALLVPCEADHPARSILVIGWIRVAVAVVAFVTVVAGAGRVRAGRGRAGGGAGRGR